MRRAFLFTLAITLITAASPAAVFASHPANGGSPKEALVSLYLKRPDLQAAFDAHTYQAIPGSSAGFLMSLEDWAYQYGWREHPELAVDYAPPGGVAPSWRREASAEPAVTAVAYLVMDRTSGQILAAKNASTTHPIASLTKLMTSEVVLDQNLSLEKRFDVTTADDVGGAKLYVQSGDLFTLDDLLYSTLVASANNAANAVARATGISRTEFVAEMNKRANELNLRHTTFVDPSGIELGNVSTAREWARLANRVFSRRDIRRYTTTAIAKVQDLSSAETKTLKNTNWMLWKPEYEDLYVMAGKTGYLDESGWNFTANIRPDPSDVSRELLLVVFGSASRADSFKDTRALSEWAWKSYNWE